MPTDPVVVTFDPHVSVAIICLLLAVVAAIMAFALGRAADQEPKR